MTDESSHSQRIDLLADEFLTRRRSGEHPTIEAYCVKYPDLAEDIRELFPTLEMMETLKPSLDAAPADRGVPASLERIGDYRILGEIGRGGMGVVYEAEQESLGRRVALKVLSERFASDDSGLVRFQKEAKAAAKMHHTNIVPIFEIGQDSDYIFYAMQLIQGQGLDRIIK
ncbi:MAG: protein kinase, partial [Phycisphaeraceae bacterium]|nr:protein kinase [Phycisphaeraceae bacterium]